MLKLKRFKRIILFYTGMAEQCSTQFSFLHFLHQYFRAKYIDIP